MKEKITVIALMLVFCSGDLVSGQTVIGRIPVGKTPTGMALNVDTNRGYVANEIDGTLTVFDLVTDRPCWWHHGDGHLSSYKHF